MRSHTCSSCTVYTAFNTGGETEYCLYQCSLSGVLNTEEHNACIKYTSSMYLQPPDREGQGGLLCTVGQCPNVPSRLCRTGKDMASSNAFACPTNGPSPPDREGQVSILCQAGQCPTLPSRLCRTSKDMAPSHAFACPTNGPSPPDREGQVSLLNTVVDTIFSRLGVAG